jgi:hypothetical protein
MEGCVMSFYVDELPERYWQVYRMRTVDGATLRKVAEAFGVTQERIRQMVARCERVIVVINAREAAATGSLGSLRLQRAMLGRLMEEVGDDWREIPVVEFMRQWRFDYLQRIPNIGKKRLAAFCEELRKVVGDEAVARWRRGEQI